MSGRRETEIRHIHAHAETSGLRNISIEIVAADAFQLAASLDLGDLATRFAANRGNRRHGKRDSEIMTEALRKLGKP